MAGRKDEQLKGLGGFAGLNLTAKEADLAFGVGDRLLADLRQSVNVDLDANGKPSRRRGRVRLFNGAWLSPASGRDNPYLYAIRNGDLVAMDRDLTIAGTIRAAVGGDRELTFAEVNGRIYWSNGREIRAIDGGLTDAPAWPVCPGQPRIAAYPGVGGLTAGSYQVAITYLDAAGRESASTLAEVVAVALGDGILVDQFPPNAEASTIRIYVSQCNGDALRLAASVPVGTLQQLVGYNARGKTLSTQFYKPMPPCRFLRHQNNILFGADGNTLRWTSPFRYGLCAPDAYWRFGSGSTNALLPITLLEPVGEADNCGVFVGSGKQTHYLAGANPKEWRQRRAYSAGAVEGTGQLMPAAVFNLEGIGTKGMVATWLARDGVFCVGLPGGEVIPFNADRAPLDTYDSGSTMLVRRNGISQLVAALRGSAANQFHTADSAVATVRRHATYTLAASAGASVGGTCSATVNGA